MKIYHKLETLDPNDKLGISKGVTKFINQVILNLQKNYEVELEYVEETLPIKGEENLRLCDCEVFIIYQEKYYGITLKDTCSPLIEFFYHNPRAHKLISPQYKSDAYGEVSQLVSNKLVDGIYMTSGQETVDLDELYIKRKTIDIIDKMFFTGNIHKEMGDRGTIRELCEHYPSVFYGGSYKYSLWEDYAESLISHSVGICVGSTGCMTYRDIENMAMGVPILRLERTANLTPELLPDYHYISISRGDLTNEEERIGSSKITKMYVDRFMEVKDDKKFLDFISSNARKYYEMYLYPVVIFHHLSNLIGLDCYA